MTPHSLQTTFATPTLYKVSASPIVSESQCGTGTPAGGFFSTPRTTPPPVENVGMPTFSNPAPVISRDRRSEIIEPVAQAFRPEAFHNLTSISTPTGPSRLKG